MRSRRPVHLHKVLSKHPALVVYTGFSTKALSTVINAGFATNTLVHAIFLHLKVDSFSKNCVSGP
jgi:hypothetical protein